MNILLLNPPGTKLYLRDCFCSHSSKSNYYYAPADFLFLSGILSLEHNVDFLDAIMGRLGVQGCIDNIISRRFDVIIFLTGGVSWYTEDKEFIDKLRNKFEGLIIGLGDVFLEEADKILKETPALDGVLLDFSTVDILDFLRNFKSKRPFNNIVYKSGSEIIAGEIVRANKEFDLPVPRQDLFVKYKYRFPFIRRYPFTVVLTDFGCPFKCSFCNTGKLGFKVRTLLGVEKELLNLKKLGIKEIFFRDQTFGVKKDRTKQLCTIIKKILPDVGWTCYSRVDIVDVPLLEAMKDSGCHTIMFGIETADETLLNRYNKGISIKQIEEAFRLCKKIGIRTVATLVLGLPGDSKESIERTVAFVKQIDCDYVSFNIAAPRIGSDLREYAKERGLLNNDIESIDNSYGLPQIETDQLSSEELWRLRTKAIKEFYLRPSYILKRFFSIKTPYEFFNSIKEAIELTKKSS